MSRRHGVEYWGMGAGSNNPTGNDRAMADGKETALERLIARRRSSAGTASSTNASHDAEQTSNSSSSSNTLETGDDIATRFARLRTPTTADYIRQGPQLFTDLLQASSSSSSAVPSPTSSSAAASPGNNETDTAAHDATAVSHSPAAFDELGRPRQAQLDEWEADKYVTEALAHAEADSGEAPGWASGMDVAGDWARSRVSAAYDRELFPAHRDSHLPSPPAEAVARTDVEREELAVRLSKLYLPSVPTSPPMPPRRPH